MPDLDWPSLAAPLTDASPCGDDLRFDEEFRRLEEAAAGEPEVEIGRPGEPGYMHRDAKGPNWPAVQEAALNLASRTRDLRVAVWLVRSGVHTQGLAGAVRGLQLVQALLAQFWEQAHPQIDPVKPDTVAQRANALGMLVHPQGALADLRAASLKTQRGDLTLREIELAFGATKPLPREVVPTKDRVQAGVANAVGLDAGLPALLRDGLDAALAIEGVFVLRFAVHQRPDATPLTRLMRHAAELAAGNAAAAAAPAPGSSAAPAGDGAIASRDDAIRGLERICEWIERNEPASPAPIFIRRSQQLLTKSFIEIIRDLMPDNVKQIEHFVGKRPT